MSPKSEAWRAIFQQFNLYNHEFEKIPYRITARQLKLATRHFSKTGQREVRILCKQDTRESRPDIFKEMGLFILPVRNGEYVIIQGEGYVDIPEIKSPVEEYNSQLNFSLVTSKVGNSEMQHLDFAFANSLIRSFVGDNSLVLTIRGRKYTPKFDFYVGHQLISVKSVQTEIDAGYEGKNRLVLIEAKNSGGTNTIIRQLYYPFKQWKHHLNQHKESKDVSIIFFDKAGPQYRFWRFMFADENDYNSIYLIESKRYVIK